MLCQQIDEEINLLKLTKNGDALQANEREYDTLYKYMSSSSFDPSIRVVKRTPWLVKAQLIMNDNAHGKYMNRNKKFKKMSTRPKRASFALCLVTEPCKDLGSLMLRFALDTLRRIKTLSKRSIKNGMNTLNKQNS